MKMIFASLTPSLVRLRPGTSVYINRRCDGAGGDAPDRGRTVVGRPRKRVTCKRSVGSNPTATASLTRQNAGNVLRDAPGVRRLVSLLVSFGACGTVADLPDQAADTARDVALDGSGDVLVPRCHGRVSTNPSAHDCSLRDAEQEQHRRRGLPGVVETAVADTSPVEELRPVRPVRAWVQRRADRAREHPAAVRPDPAALTRSRSCSARCTRSSSTSWSGSPMRADRRGTWLRRLVAQRDPVRAVTAELAPTRPVAAVLPAGS